jgi:hypothetical protein
MTYLALTESDAESIEGHFCECGGTIKAVIWHTGHCVKCHREWMLSLVLRQNCPSDFSNDDDLIPFE